ncbi:PREDICTED: DNA (cytosine-5)-methyltransferase CMT3-like [Erythranthe guttata]|uniref:DNA (cytosine-5)-methyltransferase CMT3-like n=1 Tax=Erythranthe guttata TaxID=4155 RepID=UPI00064D9773|nr:PREDICTED: DNA (cytosine-5)-methyltransferase CMT3-like [Erythranthe guttata]|eukprot:XP_012835278.1 PREDICTED: DNA (cytosine-5)-methyltransferase CMT3-like [Erythranthe guttata]
MAIKRKSRSVKTDPAAMEEDSRSNKRISSAAVESDGDFEGEDQVESAAAPVVDQTVEKVKSPVQEVKPDDEEEEEDDEGDAEFLGEPVPADEARKRWPHRYQKINMEVVQARCHFLKAEVDGQIYFLEDDAYVMGEPGKPNYIGKIIEIFEALDGSKNFTAQWFYRGGDTVLQACGNLIDTKCVFFSDIKDDNPLSCLVKKLKIEILPLKADIDVKEALKSTCEYYCDKKYLLPFSSFVSLPSDTSTSSDESGSTISSDTDGEVPELNNERTLLDLYSGCGAMSTGLCLGANSCGVKLVTKWAVDINEYACESLRLNHPETQVRNESADDFLHLLKEWEKLSSREYGVLNDTEDDDDDDDDDDDEDEEDEAGAEDSEVFEVDEILAVCYGDPNKTGNPKLHFKIRWLGYGPDYDTWEPLEGLSGCPEKLKEYVAKGNQSKMLPLPGTVDVLCGGPPCQGISGFNRFRNTKNPLADQKNEQLSIFMDIVAFLRPKFVLMENVVDIVRFAGGFLGRYALGRLLSMDYQARMGMMAAGAYGLPQFRMRMFMWGALPTERLPQYPLPTHNVVARGNAPTEFEGNVVGFEASREVKLAKELFLEDAISDLPPVDNDESRDERPYDLQPQSEFQRFIRLRRDEMPGSLLFNLEVVKHDLYDHRPLQLNQDDYERVCRIPKKKGANFRDLPGVRVRADNKVEWDPDVEREKVTSGKPLVPDYAMTFVRGTSSKPFGRLWWDQTVPTVVTRAEPHNQAILHPLQDRVLTIRENARLQGFPDYYKLLGPIKERYIQVGNAVAVPVARALGFSLALALRGLSGNEPLLTLPEDYPLMRDVPVPNIVTL